MMRVLVGILGTINAVVEGSQGALGGTILRLQQDFGGRAIHPMRTHHQNQHPPGESIRLRAGP
jgi:hypothetical protein